MFSVLPWLLAALSRFLNQTVSPEKTILHASLKLICTGLHLPLFVSKYFALPYTGQRLEVETKRQADSLFTHSLISLYINGDSMTASMALTINFISFMVALPIRLTNRVVETDLI